MKKLRNDNPNLFLKPSTITKSAIYRATPNYTLSKEQKRARQIIIDKTTNAILNGSSNQLIFVEGEAGTGKTVLATTTFFDILDSEFLKSLNLKGCLLINHDEQRELYENMAIALGYDSSIIQNPTSFLKNHSILDKTTNSYEPDSTKIMDIIFIDEGHLLWDSNNMAFNTKFKNNQLDEIIKRARVVVFMYDENQILHKDQFNDPGFIDNKRNLAIKNNNYIQLSWQFRMKCSKDTLDWIDNLTKNLKVSKLALNSQSKDVKGYEVKIYNHVSDMRKDIKNISKQDGFELSRIIATYDWDYKLASLNLNTTEKYWCVKADSQLIPWNEQIYKLDLEKTLNNRQKKRLSELNWAEKDYTIDEAGSTFTIQGFDLSYAGVILGPSVRYDKANNKIWFDENRKYAPDMKGTKTLRNGTKIKVLDFIGKHEFRVLMTRANNGLYIYACDKDLRDALKDALK